MKAKKININKACKGKLTLTIRTTGLIRFRIRKWLGVNLVRFGCWVMGVKCDIKTAEQSEVIREASEAFKMFGRAAERLAEAQRDIANLCGAMTSMKETINRG